MATVPALSSSNYQEEDEQVLSYEDAASEAPHEDTPTIYTTPTGGGGGSQGGAGGASEGQQLNEATNKLAAEQTIDEQQKIIAEQGEASETAKYNQEIANYEKTVTEDKQHYETEYQQYQQAIAEWGKEPEDSRGLQPQPPIPPVIPPPPQPPNQSGSQGTIASLGSQIGTIVKQIANIKSQNK